MQIYIPKTTLYASFVSGVIARQLAFIYLTVNNSKRSIKNTSLSGTKNNFLKITVAMLERSIFLKSATRFLCPYVSIYWGLVSYVYDISIPDSYIQELWAFRLLKKQKTFSA